MSRAAGNVLGSAKVVKRTSLRGRMLANAPRGPVSADRCMPARTPVTRGICGAPGQITAFSLRANVRTVPAFRTRGGHSHLRCGPASLGRGRTIIKSPVENAVDPVRERRAGGGQEKQADADQHEQD